MWKTLGRKPKELEDQPEFPEELRYLFSSYLEVRKKEPLTYTELKSWSELTCQSLCAWEVKVIMNLDSFYWR